MRSSPSLKLVIVVSGLVILPQLAWAQGSITGVVRDTSGAVLPGVTVEAASPALIEKVRSVVTDGTGQYRIVELRPGTYSVSFTLPGFSVVRREGIELTGTFTATINAEMRVGTIEETVTVTGESPLVDVQNVTKQTVMTSEVLDTIPTGRTHLAAAALLPGVGTGSIDVGGTNTITLGALSVHGSRGTDQRVTFEGLNTANADGSGQTGASLPNMTGIQELTVDVAAGSAEQATGGLTINLVPREGGNRFSGTFFGTGVTGAWQGSNYTQELKDRGLATPTAIKMNYDINPGGGGPILSDRLWFYSAARWMRYENYAGDIFYNRNAGDPTKWTYDPDLSRPAYFGAQQRSVNTRLTWQVNPTNKVNVFWDEQYRCWCPWVTTTRTPDGGTHIFWPLQRNAAVSWSAPLTNRLLLEAGGLNRGEAFQYRTPPSAFQGGWIPANEIPGLDMIMVQEQSTGIFYRNGIMQAQPYQHNFSHIWNWRGAASYVTGAHAFKSGFSYRTARRKGVLIDNNAHMDYRFNNGVPNLLFLRATPLPRDESIGADVGVFAQEKWTVKRLTVNAGVRFDYFRIDFGELHLGPAPLVPNRNITFPEQTWVRWKDITPRLGVSYNLFGDGKTAVKASLNKYMIAFGLQGLFGDQSSPVNRMANSVTRSWTDANGNYIPDCNLIDVNAQDLRASGGDVCGAMSNRAFGQPILTTDVDPDARIGWGKRGYNWEFSTGVQHELVPRVSVDVGYFNRRYGNFTVTDNRAVTARDYSPFSVPAPVDSRLPNGGGYVLSGLYDLNPDKVGLVDNVLTLSSNFGDQVETWTGVDASVNARLSRGVFLQAGISTGRTTTDDCEIRAVVDNPSQLYCRVVTPFLSQGKFFGTYTIPKIDVQTGVTFQSYPGPAIAANFNASSALVAPSLGRPLSGGAANVTVNLVEPGTMYGERLNQLDLRFTKLLSFGRSRTSVNLDVYNATNSDAAVTLNNNFAVWQRPLSIIMARFAKLSFQVDF